MEDIQIYEEPKGLIKYMGASTTPINEKQANQLNAPVVEEEVQIRPDRLIYLPQTFYRRKLNTIFGPGSWALIPRSDLLVKDGVVIREYALFINGHFISEALGENKYHEKNPQMTYATAAEGAKSDALTRCCKDLGIAWELWDPNYIEAWIEKWAVKVYRKQKQAWEWRKNDSKPFYDEECMPKDSKPHDEQAVPPKKAETFVPGDKDSKGSTTSTVTWNEEKKRYEIMSPQPEGSMSVYWIMKDENNKTRCTCPAGRSGKRCKHLDIVKEFAKSREKAEKAESLKTNDPKDNIPHEEEKIEGEDLLPQDSSSETKSIDDLLVPDDDILQCQTCGKPIAGGNLCEVCFVKFPKSTLFGKEKGEEDGNAEKT